MSAAGPVLRREADWASLKTELDGLLLTLDLDAHREDDPVSIVWSYPDPADREVVALVAAAMAYGRVGLLKRAIRRALAPLGPSPARALRDLDDASIDAEGGLRSALDGFVYRMTRGEDVVALYRAIGVALRGHGSLLNLFLAGWDEGDEDFQSGLGAFVHALRAFGGSTERGFFYLLSDPTTGSACKRLNLFLRWMVRGPDAVDTGLWSSLPSDRLVMPLDTHIVRICKYLGISSRNAQDWKLARQIAQSLKRLDPADPIKYDFALCHLGISGACPSRRDPVCCRECPIQSVCLL